MINASPCPVFRSLRLLCVSAYRWSEVGLDLTPEGGRRLCHATEKMIGRRIAIMLGCRILVAPVVRSKIADHVQIDFGTNGAPADADKLIPQISLEMLSLPADTK